MIRDGKPQNGLRTKEMLMFNPKESLPNKAAEQLTDQVTLFKVAASDSNESVRLAAVERLTEQLSLHAVAFGFRYHSGESFKENFDRMTGQVFGQEDMCEAASSSEEYIRKKAVERLTDQAALEIVATYAPDESVRAEAVKRLTDQKFLERIAASEAQPLLVRQMAARSLANEAARERWSRLLQRDPNPSSSKPLKADPDSSSGLLLSVTKRLRRVAIAGMLAGIVLASGSCIYGQPWLGVIGALLTLFCAFCVLVITVWRFFM